MSSGDTGLPAVIVDRVAKQFALPREQVHTLKERALHPFRKVEHDQLRALRDVSFAVESGEFFGIIGRNGSGKSTLLKCLAGIYKTTVGDIYVRGRVSTFIELGVGFNPDLPAADNIVVNGTMLGLSPREARSRVDAVIDFAELREFADLKLKNYSSGMLVRLAFSVMIQVDAEILLIDEVLAVGDAAFQQKCFDEFERIRRSGKTVLFVTHDMGAVRRFCDRAMLLEKGRLISIGDPEDVAVRYMQLNFSEQARHAEHEARESGADAGEPLARGADDSVMGDGGAEIVEAWFEAANGLPGHTIPSGEPCAFAMRVRFTRDVIDPHFSLDLVNTQGLQIFNASSVLSDATPGRFARGEEVIWRVRFENLLGADRYHVTCAVTRSDGHWLQLRDRMFSVVVTSTNPSPSMVELPYESDIDRVISTSETAS